MHGQCTCTHNMPPTLLRMLLILRPHLLQIFASHLIISGRGHLQHLSHTCACHNVCCCFNLLMYCLNRCCHSRVGIGILLHVLCTHSNTAICLTHYSPQLPHMLVYYGSLSIEGPWAVHLILGSTRGVGHHLRHKVYHRRLP